MRLFQWTFESARSWAGCTVLLAVLGVMLVGCSMPDGPPPPADDPATEAAKPAATPAEITLSGPGQLLPVTATAVVQGKTFELEVAKTSASAVFGANVPV